MLRFAISPKADMHTGDLRTALFNYLLAKQKNENFIVRIEDGEKEKNIEGKDQEILDLLALFQIDYSQVSYQSQNFKFHSAMALQLLHEKKAFSCFCSDEWLEKRKKEAEDAKKVYLYDDACRNLPAELVIDNTAPFSVRIVRPEKRIAFDDKIKGKCSFDPENMESFVILDRNKIPTRNFATAVDDMLSDISFIVQEESELENTPKQIHIRDSLAYTKEIQYAHIPTLSDNIGLKELLEEGYLPEAILNYLISIGNKGAKSFATLQEAAEWFTLDTLTDAPARFEIEKLRDTNRKYMQEMDATELSRYVGFADAEIGELARLYIAEDVATTRELKAKISPVFEERIIPDTLKEELASLAQIIKSAPYFENYDDFKQYIQKESDFQDDALLSKCLKILLTNREDGPEIAMIYKYLKNYIGELIK